MGATSEQFDPEINTDKPAHMVTLSSYYLAETEVTNALWLAVMPEWQFPEGWYDPQQPINYVNYNDCLEFVRRLNSITGIPFRLPTEAEWEYAARGAEHSQKYRFAGSDMPETVAWILSNSGNKKHVVAALKPNEIGLYDMTGNLSEWCSDWYAPYQIGDGANPQGPAEGIWRIARGASFANCTANCHLSVRNYYPPEEANSYIGLRLAYTLPNDPALQVEEVEQMPLTRVVKIAGRRVTFRLVAAEQPYYIAEENVTIGQWRKITEKNVEGKSNEVMTAMTQAERIDFVEKCRRATKESLAQATQSDINQAVMLNVIDTTSVSNKKQKRWEKDTQSVQKHRSNVKKAQKYAELIGVRLVAPDDPVLLSYKRDPADMLPLRLIIRL